MTLIETPESALLPEKPLGDICLRSGGTTEMLYRLELLSFMVELTVWKLLYFFFPDP